MNWGRSRLTGDDEAHKGGGSATRMQSTTDRRVDSRAGMETEWVLLQRSEHRTVDSKRNVIVNVHVEAANINDVTPMPEILDEIEARLGTLPKYMGLDAGYHNAWIAHLLETKGIQGVIGYRRHTHKGAHYGKYRFRYDPDRDEYICPEKQRLTWKTTTREGYRQYCCEGKTCKGCPRRAECFGASMNRKVVERHVWQDALGKGRCLYENASRQTDLWMAKRDDRTILRGGQGESRPALCAHAWDTEHAEQCFLTAAVQNIKRLVASLLHALIYLTPAFVPERRGLSVVLRARGVFRGPCRFLGKKREAGFRWLAAILPCYPSTSRPPAALARFPAGRPAASV